MSLITDTYRVALSDLYYLKRNLPILMATSLVTPVLYLVAFGYGLGNGLTMEGVSYMAFMIPGVVALTTVTSSFTTVANKLMVQKRFYESFDEMLLCPISKTSMILGKSILGIIKSMMCGSLMLLLGFFLADDLQITPLLIICMLISCTVFSMLGVAAGMIVQDLPRMNLFNSFVILPMTFLCGTMFSLDALPDAAKNVISALPLTQTSNCLRAAALGWDFPWISLAILIGYGVLFYGLCMFSLRKTN
ncbi:MAG: ABC transporter permease [Candidatus Methanomethylophilaceae archaeon]|nr:ABC transporter permease [Candidatus Methanomethylophilaceae archaeon]